MITSSFFLKTKLFKFPYVDAKWSCFPIFLCKISISILAAIDAISYLLANFPSKANNAFTKPTANALDEPRPVLAGISAKVVISTHILN